LSAHNGAFARLGGVPATVRVDNEKTAVARGAGVWGVINPVYARYAQTLRFHIDPCPPRSPQHKGKVERRIRDQRLRDDPARRHWRDLAELQRWTDERLAASWQRRICPATGRSVRESWRTERRWLGPLPPVLPEPFDVLVTRRVRTDCTVPFEGRQYSVPFTHVGRTVEIRGCAGRVQIFAEAELVAVHPRRTERRLVLDPAHYDGEASAAVRAPTPLGRLGERLQQ
ncbi:MAG: transposase family protein, partial [Gammaproteobacteria bacterium]|nr:transposase family protein [Gammaproteobacteria bacterium]